MHRRINKLYRQLEVIGKMEKERRHRRIEEIEEKLDEMWGNQNLWKEVEKFQREHGELTEEELRERFTI